MGIYNRNIGFLQHEVLLTLLVVVWSVKYVWGKFGLSREWHAQIMIVIDERLVWVLADILKLYFLVEWYVSWCIDFEHGFSEVDQKVNG